MFQIFDLEGERISWTPVGFASRAQALAWLKKNAEPWGEEPPFRIAESLDAEYVEFTYYNERHF